MGLLASRTAYLSMSQIGSVARLRLQGRPDSVLNHPWVAATKNTKPSSAPSSFPSTIGPRGSVDVVNRPQPCKSVGQFVLHKIRHTQGTAQRKPDQRSCRTTHRSNLFRLSFVGRRPSLLLFTFNQMQTCSSRRVVLSSVLFSSRTVPDPSDAGVLLGTNMNHLDRQKHHPRRGSRRHHRKNCSAANLAGAPNEAAPTLSNHRPVLPQ